MPAQITKIRTDKAPATGVFASQIALAFVRRAVAGGLTPAEARKRYLEFFNRPPVPREQRGAYGV